MEKTSQNFIQRFNIYQKERFPFLAHGALISAFTFSAISYSRISRGVEGFIPLENFLVGIFTTVMLFFLLRVTDEFKDKEVDLQFRSYLPVPRGLISLKELGIAAVVTILLQLLLNLVVQAEMLLLLVPALAFFILLRYEFFVPALLKKHPMLYVLSHMIVIPVIDFYATGLDWLRNDVPPPSGLIFFLAVSYLNGIVIEFGRKIRSAEDEEEGVETYSALYGPKRAAAYWLLSLFITFTLALLAAHFAGYGTVMTIALSVLFGFCAVPAVNFYKNPNAKLAKWIEKASGIWTLGMYLSLGGIPMLIKFFG